MKKLIVFMLLPLFLLNGTLAELGKIPELLEHYKEHKAIDPKVDLTDFLQMHYLGDDHNSFDNDRDSKLPFKKVSDYSSFDVQVILLSSYQVTEQKIVSKDKTDLPLYNKRFAEPDPAGNLQPPKIC